MSGERSLPGLGLTAFWTPGMGGWDAQMDANLRVLSALVNCRPASRTTALPGSPTNGMVYIVPSGGDANKIAVRDNGAWVYVTPQEGFRAWVVDEAADYVYTSSAWTKVPQPHDVSGFNVGVLTSNQVIIRHVFTRAVVFADEFAGSRGRAGTSAAASTTFLVRKNGSNIGTMVFGAGGTVATFTTTGTTVSFAIGDLLEVVAPSSVDATLANVAVTMAGVR